MSVLVDWHIRDRLRMPKDNPGRLLIEPFTDYGDCPPGCISYGLSTAGYDLRVGFIFLIFSNLSACIVDPKNFRRDNFTKVVTKQGETVLIPPNCFALAETLEYIEMPRDVIADVKGKSRLARAGYIMATTPIEPAWRGKITLEIGNLSPLPMRVYAGEGIGQLVFYQLSAKPQYDYDQKPLKNFQDQKGLTGPEGTCE